VATPPAIVPLILFFVAVAICFWRAPQADRLHVRLCLLAGGIWASLPLFEPSMRRSGYALVVATFLAIGLTQRLRRSTTHD
jgi:hypothetical protein